MFQNILSQLFNFVYEMPQAVVALVIILLLLLSLELGYIWGRRRVEAGKDKNSSGGDAMLAATSSLLGLMLAFSFAAGVQRHEVRKQGVIDEANAIGTAFARFDLIGEPGRSNLQSILVEYARSRIAEFDGIATNEERTKKINLSNELIADLWPMTVEAVNQKQPSGPIEASIITAVNSMLDMSTARTAGVVDRLPPAVLSVLMVLALITLAAMGLNAGLGGRMSRGRVSVFAVTLALILTVIIDFDRSREGLITTSQKSLEKTVADMEAALARSG